MVFWRRMKNTLELWPKGEDHGRTSAKHLPKRRQVCRQKEGLRGYKEKKRGHNV